MGADSLVATSRATTSGGRRERERERERGPEGDTVKVCVRIRPLNSKERIDQTKSCIRIASSADGLSNNNNAAEKNDAAPQQLIVGKDRAFTFDSILGINSTQQEAYRLCVEPLVESFFEGYNATILAYGQTGTGKTHTMSGAGYDAKGNEKNPDTQGIIPRVIKSIFEQIKQHESDREFTVRVEYIEIYNEELRDLLHPETTSKQLTIREDFDGTIVIAGAKAEVAQTKEAVFRYLVVGGASRATGSTLMNEQSSRSHAIFTLILQQRNRETGECRKSKFHLVDLAGSERAKRTGAVAGRFKESISINQGLLALGNVISALSDDRKRGAGTTNGGGHVPYRDSKLTRLLQDSLGGNSRTLMIACVSPATVNFEETLNTLKYASRAKNIKNTPIVNQEPEQLEVKQKNDEEILRMKEEIANLQTQLQQTQAEPRPATAILQASAISKVSNEATATADGDELKRASQELEQAKRCVGQYRDAVESMRTYSLEAITSLIAMERDVKSLGRPVQQRLNEIVKVLNASIQTANGSDAITKAIEPSGERPEDTASDPSGAIDDEVNRLRKELKDARNDLARDEQIFEMKNADIQRLQSVLTEAKARNEKLIERVQQLERGGQLWSNSGSDQSAKQKVSGKEQADDEDEDEFPSETLEEVPHDRASSKTASSRGLFTRREGTAAYNCDDDNVLTDHADDDEAKSSNVRSSRRLDRTADNSGDRSSGLFSRDARRSTNKPPAPAMAIETIQKLERTVATLQSKVEELQHQNGELLDGREESTRRWQVDRQKYEMQMSEAELTIETLRKAKQALEDSMLEERQSTPEVTEAQSRMRQSTKGGERVLELHEEEVASTQSSGIRRSGPVNARSATATNWVSADEAIVSNSVTKDSRDLGTIFEESVQQLMEYHDARRQVLGIIKEKKEAEQSKTEAARRVNALEMQKMRQSLSVRESISDLSKSLRVLDEKMQKENRTIEEIERLTKLKQRAERKLKTLRRQDEKNEYLDGEKQQELADLEELIVDLDSHIAFQDAELATARKELTSIKQRGGIEDKSPVEGLVDTIVRQVNPANREAAVMVFGKCLEEVARLRLREKELQRETKAASALVLERESTLSQLESGLSAARNEFDLRLQAQQQDSLRVMEALQQEVARLTTQQHLQATQPDVVESGKSDAEWQKLLAAGKKKDEYIADLEKHLVFYKSKAKQMQSQLQQLIRDSARESADGESASHVEMQQLHQRIQQLEDANDTLTKDLAAAKIYLRSSQSRAPSDGPKVVRVSKSELRELPRAPSLPSQASTASSSASSRVSTPHIADK